MAKSRFEERLDRILDSIQAGGSASRYEEAKTRLRVACDRIQESLSKGAASRVLLSIQPGFRANAGQQINVVVEIPERQFRDTLFRAYIPLREGPISLDFYGEQPVEAENPDDMDRMILDFLDRDEIKARLSDYRDLAMRK